MRDAVTAAGLPEEKDLLEARRERPPACRRPVPGHHSLGNSSASLRAVLENIDVIDARRDAMKDSIWPWR